MHARPRTYTQSRLTLEMKKIVCSAAVFSLPQNAELKHLHEIFVLNGRFFLCSISICFVSARFWAYLNFSPYKGK